jgi:protein ImuA
MKLIILNAKLFSIFVYLIPTTTSSIIMATSKADTFIQLQKEILSLQGFKNKSNNPLGDIGLGPINFAFPNNEFPLGAMHEFFYAAPEDAAATGGFISGLLSSLMQNKGAVLWVSPANKIFPPALTCYGITPDKVIFVELQKEKEILWVIEEALKCECLSAVVGEIQELNFSTSRRLQLAVEQSRVTGFLLRCNPRNINTTACATRWKITSIPSALADGMPGVGFPRWNVNLLKVRNGQPGNWQMEWTLGCFRYIPVISFVVQGQYKKAG